ncbi:hypothetical protein [Burkholderia latens]|uniref:hypothetical protein n=1 Tax=Burkholderia latens TaxID=488446 RepID=UPI001AE9BA9C|nr:hypothetical protein [Burkholderia latens]QTO52652.1 hypothetical protein J8I86_29335 [Burkholderia latens]
MNGTLTTRELFQLEMRTALDVAEGNLQQQYNDPDLALEIVDHRRVSEIVQAWPARLNWDYARLRISAIHRSCFVGLRTGNSPDVAVLAAVRVSRHRVTTSLLFLQKDHQALLPGRAMAMVDVILTAVAAFFGSATIAIDDPFPALVPYYKDYHYVTEIWRDRRRLLSKRA